ncbi:MAG: hypothetical protein NT062_09785 [Proteobacteria bacterium]|nr:hypothetical protein [Pseudomonadota bacterium]
MTRLGKLVLSSSLVVAVALAPTPAALAKCAMQELVAQLITPTTGKLPADGGILVGFAHATNGDDELTDPLAKPTWKFTSGGKPVDVTRVALAPGLTVYRPRPGSPITSIRVADKKRVIRELARDATATAAPSVVAPRVTKLEITTRSSGRGPARTATATVADPIPNDAVAVIVYAERGTAAKPAPVAISFGTIGVHNPKARTVIPWADPSRCAFNPPGMEAPPTGAKVTLAWVDAYGRVSRSSAPIEVTELAAPRDAAVED